MVIRIWDLVDGEMRTLGPVTGGSVSLGFDDDRKLRWAGGGGERVFDLEDGSVEIVAAEGRDYFKVVSSSETFMFVGELDPDNNSVSLLWKSLEDEDSRRITSHGTGVEDLAIHPSERWVVTGSGDGILRLGPVSGEEPHLLYGHRGLIRAVAFSPDGQWVASGGDDETVRLWPIPDLSRPPLHIRPLDDLLATLKSLTNLRIIEDPESSTGWKLDYAPFPGWAEVPEW